MSSLAPVLIVTLGLAAGPSGVAEPAPDAGAERSGQVPVDGIAAIVNGEVITIGEVRRAAQLLRKTGAEREPGGCGGLGAEAVQTGRQAEAGGELSEQELTAARECLIDGALVYREARRFPQLGVDRTRVRDTYRQLLESFPDRAAFEDELDRLGLTPEAVRRDLNRQLLVSAYIDNRFRATVDIDEEEARGLYRDELAPDMRERGIEPPPFEEVSGDYVYPILREREVNRRVESWLQDLHARATIRRMYP